MTPKPTDPRYKPMIDFAYETYRQQYGVTMILDVSDTKQLKSMLFKTQNLPEFDLEHLRGAWMTFLKSTKPFDREQGKPLRYFCANINRFMVQNGNGDQNRDAARSFILKTLKGEPNR